jgi:asparagine synthase (glutamine-hydrolysing)
LLRQHSGGLINLLHYGDALSMANGMEVRMPFMDYRLVEFSWRLPGEFKVKGAFGKALHRQSMRGLVPNHILDQKIKFGFNTPISQKLRDQPEILEVLTERRCADRGLFERRGIEALIQDHRSGRRDHSTLLFRLLNTELWFRRFIDVSMEPPMVPPSVVARSGENRHT